MFSFLKKKKPQGTQVTFKIDGMHCTSCSMNIDNTLEDVEGVISATTQYASARTVITYDPTKVQLEKLKEVIESLEYKVSTV